MRFKVVFLLAVFISLSAFAQQHYCSQSKIKSKQREILMQGKMAALSPQISHEMKYDVKFVHLNLFLERNTVFIKGGVTTVATVTAAVLDTFQTILHLNHVIDSIRFNGTLLTALRQDSLVKIKPPVLLNNGSSFTVTIFYQGFAPSGGSAIGSGFDTGTSGSWGNQVTWSLSESFVAYHWWPCKQILTDKIDSSWVHVTTDSTNKVGSNGRLRNVVTLGNKKRYEWRSVTPIDYYLISVAIAKYKEYKLYAKPQYLANDSIFIQNYIYDNAINNPNWISNQKVDLDKIPAVIKLYSNLFGMYPFYKEKYGHCMAPFGGGMEHQTMTSLGFFEYYIDAHELGHQWWGDNVTCKSWGDIWLNEGFATYSEFVTAQYLDPSNFVANLNSAHTNVMSQPGGSIFFTGSDTLNTGRIFNGRLTYDKGGSIIHTLRFLTNNDTAWFNALRGFQNTYKNSTASAIDFKNYYQTSTGINPTQFFNQWYYGEGYPTFNVKYNYNNSIFYLKSSQSVSMPSSTPLFITPMEYKISRAAMADTFIRVMHNVAVENYSFALIGTVTAVVCDPKNWVINKVIGPVRDATLGITPAPNGFEEQSNAFETIKVGPNPSKGIVKVMNSYSVSGKVCVYDLNGKLIIEQALLTENTIDLNQCASGYYLLKIKDDSGNEQSSHKILKQ